MDSYGSKFVTLNFSKKTYLAHKVIYFMKTGEVPKFIDHINGNGHDNRWINLRAATREQNNRNRRLTKVTKTGIHGVYVRGKSYRCVAYVNKKPKSLGTYDNIFDAACARFSFQLKNDYHPNHGRR